MKRFLEILSIYVGAAVVGTLSVLPLIIASSCTTVPTAPTAAQVTLANAVEDALSVGLVPVFAKNPSYLPAAQGIAVSLTAFTGQSLATGDITAIAARAGLGDEDSRLLAGMVVASWGAYQRRYAEQTQLRPDVRLFMVAVANGIRAAAAAVSKG